MPTPPASDTFVNYYEILGMPRDADENALEKRIKEELRTWRKRQASPDLHKRQEAEVRVEHLALAREVLLTPAKRAAFDQALKNRPTVDQQPESGNGSRDWLALTQEYLARNDYHSAAYAAREATQVNGDSALAWNLRAHANGGLGNLSDATYEARQATELDPTNPQYHFDLGSMLEQSGRWSDARVAFQAAANLDPSAFLYPLAIAGVYLQTDEPSRALPLLEKIHRDFPGEVLVNYYLASCLHDLAEQVPAVREGASYWITSPEEIAKMETLIDRANQLRYDDANMAAALKKLTGYVDECKQSKFAPSMGCSPLATLGFITVCLVIGGFGEMGSGSAGGGIVMVLIGIGLGFAMIRSSWRPGWKINRSLHRSAV
jgi:tetratricopeptide (TPR) repeat protein